jgi:hypothetical protein
MLADEEKDLRARVLLMRELGITSYGMIVLDPSWSPPREPLKARSAAEQDRISKRWATWREREAEAQLDGTRIPEQPSEPEDDPAL